MKLDSLTKLYSYVGAKGVCGKQNFITGPFQGGQNKWCYYYSCTGGAATFISRDPNGRDILLISGAGGGSGSYTNEFFGGVGDPFAGDALGDATRIPPEDAKKVRGKGATLSKPGEGGIYVGDGAYPPNKGTPGKYLKGGDGSCSAGGSSGGGGSGYFGGGGGADLAGGGGGSSYASPDLYNVILLGGDKEFRSPNGDIVTGHTGNGFIRIEPSDPFTLEKNTILCKCTYQCNNFIIYAAQIFIMAMESHACIIL